MNKKIKRFLELLGFFYAEKDEFSLPYDHQLYQVTGDIEKIQAHRDFLRSLNEKEEKRLESIDAKTTQMIAQTGIIFSLLGIFVPIFLDKASFFHITIKIILLFILILACVCHILTIHNALKNYQINKFKYASPSPQNVLDLKDIGTDTFLAEEVRDLLYAHAKNQCNNNRRATNLLHSYQAFRMANILTGLLVIVFSISMFFYKQKKDTVEIETPVKIQGFDTLMKRIESITSKRDTIIIVTSEAKKPESNIELKK